jgi:hypothetical protein
VVVVAPRPSHAACFGLAALALAACRPEFDRGPSLVEGPRVLALRSSPAEARPGDAVTFSALLVDPSGTRTDVKTDWAFCNERKPLTELGPVAPACLAASGPALAPFGSGASATSTLPPDGCRLFGPDPPEPKPGEPPGRPVDPDPTGGYYQPLRLLYGVDGGDARYALGGTRLFCSLPGVNQEIAADFARRYRRNENPALASLRVVAPNGDVLTLAPEGTSDALSLASEGTIDALSLASEGTIDALSLASEGNRSALTLAPAGNTSAPAPALEGNTSTPAPAPEGDTGAPSPARFAPGTRLRLVASWPSCPAVDACGDAICGPDETIAACPADCTTPAGCQGAESYLALDPATRALAPRRETIRVAWFSPAGRFDGDATGEGGEGAGPDESSNGWILPDAPGTVPLWVVVRDDRGGVAFASYRVEVGE